MNLHIQEHVLLAPLTTMQLGGEARYLIRVASVEQLIEALTWAKEQRLPWHVLSGGSNTVFLDEGFSGLVIKIEITGTDWQENGKVIVGAGELWDPFVEHCVAKNLAGVECLSGIPGMVGATPIQNVAAYGQQVSTIIEEVRTLEVATLREEFFSSAECGFGHRSSRFKYADAGKYVVTGIVFQLRPGGEPMVTYPQVREALQNNPQPTLQDLRDTVLNLRRRKSMVLDSNDPNTRSCGSFFENPLLTEISGAGEVVTFDENEQTRVPSAWLIEQAGFPKGFRRGGVGISANHNLALVNYGGTAKELLALAADIQAEVKQKFGVELKPEPIIVRSGFLPE